jgi:hypothetical protein
MNAIDKSTRGANIVRPEGPSHDIINIEGIPNNAKRVINLLQMEKSTVGARVIGSYSYKGMIYSGDIDLFESIEKEAPNILKFFKRNIRRIVKRIEKDKKVIYGEVKMGIDERYNINLGTCSNNAWTIPDDLPMTVKKMRANGLLSGKETHQLLTLMNKKRGRQPTQSDFEYAGEILKGRGFLRWSVAEVRQGRKRLPDGKTMTIEEALQFKSNINIEVIYVLGDKYIDVSNFFVLSYPDDAGDIRAINMSQKVFTDITGFMLENLRNAIYVSLYSKHPKYYNPIKTLKRLYSFLRIENNSAHVDIFRSVSDILNSKIGYYGKVLSEAKCLLKVAELKVPYKSVFKKQLQQLKYALQKCIFVDVDDIKSLTDDINDIYTRKLNRRVSIIVLKEVIREVTPPLFDITIKEMERRGVLPLNPIFIPPPDLKPF